MTTARQSITIARAPEDVFDFMLDFSRASRWRPMISSMETLDGEQPHAGSRIRLRFWSEGREHTQETTLVVCDRPRHQTYVTDQGTFVLRLDFELRPAPGGTLVLLTAQTTGRSLGAKLTIPLIRSGHRVRFRTMLEGLKREVEEQDNHTGTGARTAALML